jgi:hypothetical protein
MEEFSILAQDRRDSPSDIVLMTIDDQDFPGVMIGRGRAAASTSNLVESPTRNGRKTLVQFTRGTDMLTVNSRAVRVLNRLKIELSAQG